MRIFDLPTPALIADADLIAENMLRMNEIIAGKDIGLRPHYKSHKCASLAHKQIKSGAIGMTCAKLSEAEDLVFSGINDILIANQVVYDNLYLYSGDSVTERIPVTGRGKSQ